MRDFDVVVDWCVDTGTEYSYFQFALGARCITLKDSGLTFNFDRAGKIIYMDRSN